MANQPKASPVHQGRLADIIKRTRKVHLVGPMPTTLPTFKAETDLLIGVDGGSEQLPRNYYHLTLGDGDSLKDTTHPLDIPHPQDKNQSDLALTLALLPLDLTYEIHLWGFAEGRLDHQLFNLGELAQFLRMIRSPITVHYHLSQGHMLALPTGQHSLALKGTFSVFSLSAMTLSIQGHCRWPLKQQYCPPLSSLTLSNEALGMVDLTCNEAFFVYQVEA